MESPLETYLRDINEVSLLTAEEERALARRVGQGDSEARDRMIRANLRLVVNIARGYTRKGLALQDLIEEGNLGLLRAVEGFDPEMMTRFSTYASYWIKQSIKRALINTAKPIRIPAYMVEIVSRWRNTAARLNDEFGRPPLPEEIAKAMQIPKRKLGIIKKAVRAFTSSPQTEDDGSGWTLGEMLMDERSKSPAEELLNADDIRTITDLLDKIDQREAKVLRMRFGIEDNEPKTLKEIGEKLGLTRERVRQIENEALRRMNGYLSEEDEPVGSRRN